MKEKACVAPPQGDAEPMIQLMGVGGIVFWVRTLGDGLPEGMNGGDGILGEPS